VRFLCVATRAAIRSSVPSSSDVLRELERNPLSRGARRGADYLESHPATQGMKPRADWLERGVRRVQKRLTRPKTDAHPAARDYTRARRAAFPPPVRAAR
jgi:hypothetical protein